MVTKIFVFKKWIFWKIFEVGHSWTFIWTFLRCVKMVFFSMVFGPSFLPINVGTHYWKTILTQRAEVCQKYFEDFLSYNLVGKKRFENRQKKHDFDTARKNVFCLYIEVGKQYEHIRASKLKQKCPNLLAIGLVTIFRTSNSAKEFFRIQPTFLKSAATKVDLLCGCSKILKMPRLLALTLGKEVTKFCTST